MLALAAVVVMAIGGFGYYASTLLSNHAQASTSRQYCIKNSLGQLACLNAWNGGPYVKVYTHTGTINNYFWLHKAYSGHFMLTATGTYNTTWNGKCIGDAKNNPAYYDTSLDPCPSTLTNDSGGWGTNFYPPTVCTNSNGTGIALKNVHTGLYLAPDDYSNGASWNIGGTGPASEYCFTTYL